MAWLAVVSALTKSVRGSGAATYRLGVHRYLQHSLPQSHPSDTAAEPPSHSGRACTSAKPVLTYPIPSLLLRPLSGCSVKSTRSPRSDPLTGCQYLATPIQA